MKRKTILFTVLLLLFSCSLFAGITVDIAAPAAEGELPETIEMILKAVTAGVEQAGAVPERGGLPLETWFRSRKS